LDTVLFPTIEIKPVEDNACLDSALLQLEDYSWLVLTSINAADAFTGRMLENRIERLPKNLKVAAIGPKTADKLRAGGISPDLIPEKYLAEAILPGLGDLQDRWVLLPMADIALDTLPNAIQSAGGTAHVVTVYHTVPADLDISIISEIESGVDFITFTSGSTVRNFFTLIEDAGFDPRRLPGNPTAVCIGPKTEIVAADLGFERRIVANPHTTDGMVSAIRSMLSSDEYHEN